MITKKQLKALKKKMAPYIKNMSAEELKKKTLEGERDGQQLWFNTFES